MGWLCWNPLDSHRHFEEHGLAQAVTSPSTQQIMKKQNALC